MRNNSVTVTLAYSLPGFIIKSRQPERRCAEESQDGDVLRIFRVVSSILLGKLRLQHFPRHFSNVMDDS